jgi:hypothetical protein
MTTINWFLLFREMIAVYCENHMKHINMLGPYGKNAQLFNFTTGGTTRL